MELRQDDRCRQSSTCGFALAGGNRVNRPVKVEVRRFSDLSQHVLHLGLMVEKATHEHDKLGARSAESHSENGGA